MYYGDMDRVQRIMRLLGTQEVHSLQYAKARLLTSQKSHLIYMGKCLRFIVHGSQLSNVDIR